MRPYQIAERLACCCHRGRSSGRQR